MCNIDLIIDDVYSNIFSPKLYIFIGILTLLHNIIKDKPSTKYFMMHFLFNMYVVYNTYSDMFHSLTNINQLYKVDSFCSFTIIIFHMYHVIIYRKLLTLDDVIHHVINVFIIIPITWLYSNSLLNTGLFFMTGLPGGIIYFILWLKEHEYVSKMLEKKIAKHINIWIRCPGCTLVAYLIFQGVYTGHIVLECSPFVANLLACILIGGTYWNGIYFASSIVESHAKLIATHSNK